MESMTLSLVEIIMMVVLAITIGITIHFFISSRRSFREATSEATGKNNKELESWKLKYFNETELKDRELDSIRHQLNALREQLNEVTEDNSINSIEAEEMRKENKKLLAEIDALRKAPPPAPVMSAPALATGEKPDYIEQLRQAQSSLMDHNDKINKLLEQIDIIKETEEKQQEVMKLNEELHHQLDTLKFQLSQKEKEVTNIQQKAHLTREMTSMLDNAYSEFNTLQDKILKLEQQVSTSKKINLEYEDLKERHYKVMTEFDEMRVKYNGMTTENQELHRHLEEAQEKLRDTAFQKQQLQKRVAYLEELNNDMHAVSDANKKLESQLKRIGELESMLNVVAEERDELAKKQVKNI